MTRARHPVLLRVGLVATSLVATWCGGELGAWMMLRGDTPPAISEDGLYGVENDPVYGYQLLASHEQVSTKKKPDGSACYSVTYRTDALRRRSVGTRERVGRPNLLLFGCSVTMGEGLKDEDTLQYALADQLPDVNVLDYAVHGWGPTHALRKLQSGEIAPHRGAAVYMLIPAHVSRVIGDSRTFWLFDAPYYEVLPDGSVRGGESLRSMRPWRTVLQEALVAAKRHSWLLTALHAEFPLRHGEADFEQTAAVLAAARDSYRKQFGGEFFVAFHPTWDLAPEENRVAHDRLLALLEKRGVPVLDHAREGSSPPDVIDPDCDWHPSGALNRTFAAELAVDLVSRAPEAVLPPPGTLVLVYHRIGADPASGDAETVSVAHFEEQMQELAARGYRTLSLDEMARGMRGEGASSGKTVVIIFDDGWKTQALALPVLRRLGFKASFAIFPGTGLGWDYFEWPDVEAISADPLFEVFSHSMTHPWDKKENMVSWVDGRSSTHTAADSDVELFESKRLLESRLHEPVEFFAWPRGWYNDRLVERAVAAGYRGLLTIEPGTNAAGDDPRFLKRVMVDGRCSLGQFREILERHYYPNCSPEDGPLEYRPDPYIGLQPD